MCIWVLHGVKSTQIFVYQTEINNMEIVPLGTKYRRSVAAVVVEIKYF